MATQQLLGVVLRAIGTLLLVAVFLPSLIHHAAGAEAMIPQTEAALSRLIGHTVGREMAQVIYWASSALLLGGPLLVLGVFVPALRKLGALLLFVFLAGVTPTMHDFWAKTEQGEQQAHLVHFLKNLSLMGALLLILAEPAATPARTGGSASRTTARKQQKKLH